MCQDEHEIKTLLESAKMNVSPNNHRADAVREHTLDLAGQQAGRRHRRIGILVAASVVLCVSGIGIAATDTGRQFVRWIFLPISSPPTVEWENEEGDKLVYSRNSGQEFTEGEQQAALDELQELDALKKAGAGRLVGIFESPDVTTHLVEFSLSDGSRTMMGQERPAGVQAERMRIDEIEQLLAEGAGKIIQHREAAAGMGLYTIRFTLSDGKTVDIMTNYPPGPRSERDAIFAETRQLRANLDFEVINPASNNGSVWATLQYTLADGRKVCIAEAVPSEIISDDGTQIILPRTDWPEGESNPTEAAPASIGD